MKISTPHPDRDHLAFPHFDAKYKCCCGTVHVKQGCLMIGIVSSIMAIFGLFSTLFSKEAFSVVLLELVYLAIEVFCIVLLFLAVSKNKKLFLLPFGIYQVLSLIICAILAVLCVWVMFDSNNFLGVMIKESIVSKEEIEMEKIKPELEGKMMIQMAAAFLATAFVLSFFVSAWWLSVLCRCYKYFADMEKHREPYDTTVMYNVQNEARVY